MQLRIEIHKYVHTFCGKKTTIIFLDSKSKSVFSENKIMLANLNILKVAPTSNLINWVPMSYSITFLYF